MTASLFADCIAAGLGYQPNEQEVVKWSYGRAGKKLTQEEQLAYLESAFQGENRKWRLQVLNIICQIKPGQLISYGNLAHQANRQYGLNIGPRNAAWLRKQIYLAVGHDTAIPIHRVANEGDTQSIRDHPVTQHINQHKRTEEGSFCDPIWLMG